MNDLGQLEQKFAQCFGMAGGEKPRVFFAPGRVNLIGEHTDYNGGYVFPAALSYGTWAFARVRRDGVFRFASTGFDKQAECRVTDVVYRKEDDWANYPKGVIWGLLQRGANLSGCDILYHGNVPNGAGLSSSASIELVTAVALSAIDNLPMSMIDLVKLSQQAENQFVGVNCGIMDQFAVGMGKAGHAMLLKCNTLDFEYVPLSLNDYKLVITHTNKKRGLADSKYNERRRECEEGFGMIRERLPSASCLGDVTEAQWRRVREYVGSEIIRRRLEHVVSENARVIASRKALEAGDLDRFGELMSQSHESLRDLYEVTGAELDTLVEEARSAAGCIGTRMTGAGFGGCTVSLVHRDKLEDFQRQVRAGYYKRIGIEPAFHVCDVGSGAKEMFPAEPGEEGKLCPF